MARRGIRATIVVAAALALAPPAHADQRLITIDTPSKYVDVKTAVFNGDRPKVLHANVLLPDGYDADKHKRWPVLYLLHGVGDNYSDWAKPAKGDIKNTAKGFPGIIVMPEGGKGFYTNWFNRGKRADPAWESYYETELMPQVAKRFRIAPGRRNHAIAGLSMGGMGATYLGSQRPDYFGTVSSFSGFVEHQRAEVGAGFSAVAGVSYEDIFGPMDGEYASGHNPTKLAANLKSTPVFVAAGNGTPAPGVDSSPSAVAGGGAVELEISQENQEFDAALEAAGVDVDYRPQAGVHDWPYWRSHLQAAIKWGMFKPTVVEHPTTWTYKTIATTGRMWSLRFAFAKPPEKVATFERSGPVLTGAGEGTVRLTDIASGCSNRVKLPFKRSKFFAPRTRRCRH
jgi:S-formylglutathione hydrolase FrmB